MRFGVEHYVIFMQESLQRVRRELLALFDYRFIVADKCT